MILSLKLLPRLLKRKLQVKVRVYSFPQYETYSIVALAAVQPAEGVDPPPPEIAEFIKPKTDTAAVLSAWSKVVGGGSLGGQLNTLEHYLLPLPSSALKLFYAIALFLNLDPVSVQDVTGELTWELFKKVFLPNSNFD